MKLIDLLVKELPQRGGWPDGAVCATQDGDGEVFFSEGATPEFGFVAWHDGDWCGNEFHTITATDYDTAIITRAQYEAALAKNDGWIEWGGGECPVDGDLVVDVKYNGFDGVYTHTASTISWERVWHHANIIAYRLHCDINASANDDRLEQDLNECIGQGVGQGWNGDGLPPAGAEFEHSFHANGFSTWHWRKCTAVGKHGVLCVDEKDTELYLNDTNNRFRPLRTEAERAREDAETAIRTCLAGTGAGITPLAAKGIYEAIAAGKIPGVKLENK